ncbi:tRNA (cytosine34-2'-O-)-methyltransferase [Paenibacillus sp. JCM 10914]|nr:tRNA (cytosine34-2'-O-)-methyltransferase [Paenibacillus sp. JCM 10914]
MLELDMPVEIFRARQEVQANEGRIALQRGPIVYCIEQSDHDKLKYDEMTFSARERLLVEHREDLLEGVTTLRGKDGLGRPCQFVPYYAWDNRQPGYMQVWVREKQEEQLYNY